MEEFKDKLDKVETLKIERILKRFKIEKGFGLDKTIRIPIR